MPCYLQAQYLLKFSSTYKLLIFLEKTLFVASKFSSIYVEGSVCELSVSVCESKVMLIIS